MTTAILDTLLIVERARKARYAESQAKFQARLVAHMLDLQIATKQDIKELESKIELKFADMKTTIIFSAIPIIS